MPIVWVLEVSPKDCYLELRAQISLNNINVFRTCPLINRIRKMRGSRSDQSFQAKLDTKTILGQVIKRFNGKSLFINQPPPAVVHIHSTSGEGDNICLMRYLPLLVEKGYTVRYEAKAGAVKLARDSFHDIEVIQLATDYPGTTGVSDFDYHLPTDDLPYVLQTELDTIPWSGPYIKSDSELVKKYKSCKNKIGICWSTGPKSGQWKERYLYRKSIVFDLLKPIIEIDPCRFVAVQAGPTRLVNNLIADVLPKDERLLNWAETAALIENLDLLISIDTSVAHLAASMGKQVWLMLSDYSYGWQFMAKRPDCSWNDSSPWYPSMRIFRQRERDDWDPVINDIVKELEIKYGSRS